MNLSQLENHIAELDTDTTKVKEMKELYRITAGTKYRIYEIDSMAKANLKEFFYFVQSSIAYEEI